MPSPAHPADCFTPEFLIWALEHTCAVRGFQNGSDPERTERQLRAARAISDAEHEGRVWEGLAVWPPRGFRISSALDFFGGDELVRAACQHCLVNVLVDSNPASLAGCYGMVVLPLDPAPFHAACDVAAQQSSLEAENFIIPTTPAWYGLWMSGPLTGSAAGQRLHVLRRVVPAAAAMVRGLADLLSALELAQRREIRLHVIVYPAGKVTSGNWQLAPHCPRCHADWETASRQKCRACGCESAAADVRKRKARGLRPYVPLSSLLGSEQAAAAFLLRYDEFQSSSRRQDPAQCRQREAPLDSLPADSNCAANAAQDP